MIYTFTGPGTYVFPELAGPPESEAGTLTTVPGETYSFDGDPPGPASWWSVVVPPPPPSPAAGKKAAATTTDVPATTASSPADTAPATETTPGG